MLFALASSLLYGVSDFLGGVAARRVSTLVVTAVSYLGAAAALGLVSLAVPGVWSAGAIRAGVLAGIAAVAGMVAFYAALGVGPISVLAPGIALMQSLVPVAMGVLVLREGLGVSGWVGIVVALTAGALLGTTRGAPAGPVSRRAVLLAVLAGVTLGLSVVAIDTAPRDAGMVPVLLEVVVGLVLLVGALVVTRTPVSRGALRLALFAGVLAGAANACLMAALYRDALAVVAVLLGLYPLGTVLLARLVLGERMSRPQLTGVGLAVLGSVLLGL